MNYYRVLYSNEYAKKKGCYGIIDCKDDFDRYVIKDEHPFPKEIIDKLIFQWEGNENKIMADIQMSYFPWRLISEKAYNILKKYNSKNDIYFHEVQINKSKDLFYKYYIMHFYITYDILVKDEDYKRLGLYRPQIKTNSIKGVDVLMYDEFDPNIFLISEKVKMEFEQNDIKGAEYQLITKSI
jgi:hypothetical protein